MKRLLCILFSTAAIGAGTAAMAGPPRHVNAREYHQQQRIFHGVRGDELTRREFGRLEAQQAGIRVYERRARSDGDLSFRERRRLANMLDRSSRNIYRQTHDRQDRNP
jgi:hypothetical protein